MKELLEKYAIEATIILVLAISGTMFATYFYSNAKRFTQEALVFVGVREKKPDAMEVYYKEKAKQEKKQQKYEVTLEDQLRNCKWVEDCKRLSKLYEAQQATKIIVTEVRK